jgi:hypothetical protein
MAITYTTPVTLDGITLSCVRVDGTTVAVIEKELSDGRAPWYYLSRNGVQTGPLDRESVQEVVGQLVRLIAVGEADQLAAEQVGFDAPSLDDYLF